VLQEGHFAPRAFLGHRIPGWQAGCQGEVFSFSRASAASSERG
jgi:hypothetical protein